jgi:hypothetical protein
MDRITPCPCLTDFASARALQILRIVFASGLASRYPVTNAASGIG